MNWGTQTKKLDAFIILVTVDISIKTDPPKTWE